MALPPYVTREVVAERLPLIFPPGTPNRNYCVRELSASTIFAMLYIGAVEGTGRYLGPIHVYRMTDRQANRVDEGERIAYSENVAKRGFQSAGNRWYADNTREPIRDETLREGLITVGAVIVRDDLPTTSSKPRYALISNFAALFDPSLAGKELKKSIVEFQESNLSKSALARISIIRAGAAAGTGRVLVTFPNGETRHLAPGPSSIISQAVIEIFAKRFLDVPAVLWLSESGNKVVARDDKLAAQIGLQIEADRNLPDLILADLGPKEPLIVFVEVVATDGAITPRRQDALLALTDAAGFKRGQIAFVTAYLDRESPGFKKTVSSLAWDTFAWFVSEPNNVLILCDGDRSASQLFELVDMQSN